MKSILDLILDSIFDADVKGKAGEQFTANKLGWINFLGFKGKVLRNIYIPKDNGETSEIDLIYITKKGIFVIESKNYSGYVFGSEDNQYWTITLNAGNGRSTKTKLYNPIKQNRTHIKWLANYLNDDTPLLSAIVFSDRCKFKGLDFDNTNELFVCHRQDLTIAIGKRWFKLPDSLSEEKVEEIFNKLEPLTNADAATKKQHIDDIKVKQNICPECGGELVKRKGKYGYFIGCSNYPKCTFTSNKK